MATFPIHGSLEKETRAGAVAKQLSAEVVDTNYFAADAIEAGSITAYDSCGIGVPPSASAWLRVGGSAADYSSIRLSSGTAPTVPINGDIWFDGTALKMRIGGVTKTFTVT